MNKPHPLVLIILDGWGYRQETENNAIAAAHTPFWNYLLEKYPHMLISGSGKCVGLPSGQMGNSEVGHLNMGSGRIVHQDLTRIDTAIADKEFFTNPVLVNSLFETSQQRHAVHVIGLLSAGGVHSHENHFLALLQLAKDLGVKKLYFHAFLDGRDTPPKSALQSLKKLQQQCDALNCGKIISVIGRYYAMDRDKRWDRVEKAYDLLTSGIADFSATNASEGIELAYQRGETDEFVKPTTLSGFEPVKDGDAVIFMNFRADRARELTSAMTENNFTGFTRKKFPTLSSFTTLTEYDPTFNVKVAFKPESLKNIFADCISQQGLKQLRIAETEKYAHVTFFFNGGIETPFPNEERILIPSPKVATYDLKPEMSAYELTDKLIQEIKSQKYDVIICNFANPDMVGHTGNFAATVKAIETIDTCLEKIITTLIETNGEALITADHGNAELMFDKTTGQPHTAHTTELVPLVYIGRPAKVEERKGILSDISPTMLYLLGLKQPEEMTGKPLVTLL